MRIQNENQMLAVSAQLAKYCRAPLVIYLSGPLGAGKTTFSRGFLQGLGYVGRVKSPTYTLVESYLFADLHVYHFDFYRIHDAEELELIGIREYFHQNAISLIEWPEQGMGRIPQADIVCSFHLENEGRRLEFMTNSIQGDQIIKKLMTCSSFEE